MGDDEYHPITHKGSNLTKAGGIGYTVIDSIDTMLLMGLDNEYERARDWVATKLSFERDGDFNTFEVSCFVHGLSDSFDSCLDHDTSARWSSLCTCAIWG
jgi:endoplasmic reticulum Man9GlcNAc2 1,2-alpha-mannosidase